MASLEGDTPSLVQAKSSHEELRVVLLGKTGAGKSSSGNTILGRDVFKAEVSPRSVTSQCERQSGNVAGRSVTVIDTPGFFDTRASNQGVVEEMARCILLALPGPHVFLVLMQVGRFTQEERDALQWIEVTFGERALRYTMVLFTWGDQLRGKTIDEFLEDSTELQEFAQRCQGGCHVFNNTTPENRDQVFELLEKIENMVTRNGGSFYTNEMFLEAESAIREVQESIMGERRKEAEDEKLTGTELERRESEENGLEQEKTRKQAERLFWCELLTAVGKGAAEGAGVLRKGESPKKAKVVKRAAALATTPLSLTSAAKMLGGAVREGSKVLYKHRKTFLR